MQVIAPVSGLNWLLFKQQVIAEIYNIIYSNQWTSWDFKSMLVLEPIWIVVLESFSW